MGELSLKQKGIVKKCLFLNKNLIFKYKLLLNIFIIFLLFF